MQTSGIGSQEQWARFMQVSNAARMRNQGLATGIEGIKAAATRKTAAGSPVRAASVVHRVYAPSQTPAPARILGGKFDAFA